MKADVSVVDWSEQIKPKILSRKRSRLGIRQADRVPVKLSVAIAAKDCAYLAESVDISESGLLINYDGPKLRKGKKVIAIIKGIISDEETDGETSTLYVARVSGQRMALTFC